MTLAVRAWHIFISAAFYSVQKLRTVHLAVRVNVLNFWGLACQKRARAPRGRRRGYGKITGEQCNALCEAATGGQDFVNIRLDQPVENMFFRSFETRLEVKRP